jgi:hypothetical protein
MRPGSPGGAGQVGAVDGDPQCGGARLGRERGQQAGQPVGQRRGGERER